MAFPDSQLPIPNFPAGQVNQAVMDNYITANLNALAKRVADPGWTNVATLSGYNSNTLSVKLIANELELDGFISKTSGSLATTDTPVATLPSSAYSPRSSIRVPVLGYITSATTAIVGLIVDPGSTSIRLIASAGSPGAVYLSHVRWAVA